MSTEDYTNWVNNEYNLWKNSLLEYLEEEEKFKNFRSTAPINRMVGISNLDNRFADLISNYDLPWKELELADSIGNPLEKNKILDYNISNISLRYIYYANKILDLINSTNVKFVEIGAGYGGLCSIINIIARYRNIKIDEYAIYDLPEVQQFQKHYLKTLFKSIDIFNFLDCNSLNTFSGNYDFCISCYALGEFDNETKANYIVNVISKIKNGLIIWNPHKEKDPIGESLLLQYHPNLKSKEEYPLTSKFNLEIIL